MIPLKLVFVILPLSQPAESELFWCIAEFLPSLELFYSARLGEIRNNSYTRSKVSLKLLMACLRHFKWAICLNIFLSLSLSFFWSFPRLIHEPWEGSFVVSVSWSWLPPLNTSTCLHNVSFDHAAESLNLERMNGPLSEGLVLRSQIHMQKLTSEATECGVLFLIILQATHWESYEEAFLNDPLTISIVSTQHFTSK